MTTIPWSTFDAAKEQANIYRIFSNENRLLILWLLSERPMSVNDLSDAIGASIQNTSQHLRLMKTANILESQRNGQSIIYSIANSEIGRYCRKILLPENRQVAGR
jgi:DNA-binding transcriptional ArsR family regulator